MFFYRFLWVKFQLEDLCTAETDAEICAMLQNLPKDLSETYDRLLGRATGKQREQLIRRMFEWILCSKRPLHIEEMREAIAFTIDDDCWDDSKIPNDMSRLARACGNLVVIDDETATVQFAHYTVEQYLLSRPVLGSCGQLSLHQANIAAAEMCLAYISFTDFEAQVSPYVDKTSANMAVVESLVKGSSLMPDQQLANTALRIWSSVHPHQKMSWSGSINYFQYVSKRKLSNDTRLEKYKMLGYVIEFWLLHTSALDHDLEPTSRAYVLFDSLLSHKRLLFSAFPWSGLQQKLDSELQPIARVGWAMENNHGLLLRITQNTYHILEALMSILETNLSYFPHIPNEAYRELNPDHPPFPFISQTFLNRLEGFKGECPNSRGRACYWLFSKYVSAARQGHLRVFISTCHSSRELICYALLEAVAHGQFQIVKYLLPQSTLLMKMEFPDASNPSKRLLNALEVAAVKGYPDIVQLIVEVDSPLYIFDFGYDAIPALLQAVNQGNTPVVDGIWTALVSRKLPNLSRRSLNTSISREFHSACIEGNIAVARELLGKFGYFRPIGLDSALHGACENGQHEILELLFSGCYAFRISEVSMRSSFQNIARLPHVPSIKLFLEHLEENYTDPVDWIRLVQSPLFAAARVANMMVVKCLLHYCRDRMPSGIDGHIADAGSPNCNWSAISQAASLKDFTALKTLIKVAGLNLDFIYLETCIDAVEYFPSLHRPHLPADIDQLLRDVLHGKHPTVAMRMVEMLLDPEPRGPLGDRETKGELNEVALLRIAEICATDLSIVETLLSAGGSRREFDDKYYCMALYTALECSGAGVIGAILEHYDFQHSRYSQELRRRALSKL
jgi:ankyrin repeat protein